MADAFEEALALIAKLDGKSIEDVKKDLAREALARAVGKNAAPEPAPPVPVPQQRALARADTQRLPARRPDADEEESAEEAERRWIEEETLLPDGVFGLGGQTAGGIFGGGAIATSTYDPESMGRGDQRMGHALQLQTARALDRLTNLLDQAEGRARGALPATPSRRRLPR